MHYFFVGMPLAGKSTIAKRLAAEESLPYLSTGDLARSLGMGLEPSIGSSDLSVTHNDAIVERVMAECLKDSCVVDGFPRSIDQFKLLVGREPSGFRFRVLFVTANPLVIYDRMSRRRETDRRPEDTIEVVAGRIRRAAEWRRELEREFPRLEVIREEALNSSSERVLEVIGVR